MRDDLANELLSLADWLTRWATRNSPRDIPWAHARTLTLVEDSQPTRITSLAAAAEVTQPAMTSSVQRLEADGLIRRIPDPKDGRAGLVELTDRGALALARSRAQRADALARVLADHSIAPDDLGAAVAVLRRIADAAGMSSSGSPTPVGAPPPSIS